MRPEDLRFQVLRHLEQKPDMTQRELAATLGISLGRVNYCVQALIERGFVKAANFRNSRNKRAYLYKLTPNGLTEKAALALRFLRRKEQERQALLQEIEALRAELGEASSHEQGEQ
ncbi:MarR family EPS-associated transcriptional regulator [Nitrococcus mobilis]|uniref:Transcriptional regulator (MarR family) protein n=1 Tax=Nitrococcus mobilis Nb-231 TaxID=314278 RepID=A4BMF3_9GAMM|nr:MarR family EPS-associated transcriptional regulator [Nitrococcus mobilis]EAR23491.1 transcriptional regulator (MarR family) protein [Nitrococcus mobilis Nb-231]